MNKSRPKIYRTLNWSSYNRTLINRGNIAIGFDPNTQWYEQELVVVLFNNLHKIHCIKLLGDKLTARYFQRQANKIHARVGVLNKYTDLGRPHTRVIF